MKPVFNERTPKFKTAEEKSFKRNERSQECSTDRLQKPSKGKLSLSRQNQRITPENIYPTEARKANGQGQVTINVKQSAFLQKEKKTGPLSPRAPEKIKKNRAEEMKIYGENSCLTLFAQRPTSIVRLWATVEGAKKVGDILSYLAEHKKAYHIVSREEMEKVTGSEHHGDVCLLVKKNRTYSLEGYLQLAHTQDCLVLLDGVNNAQNIGGIVRTCAFYGVKGIISENGECLNSSSAARVAEGGLEFVHTLETK
ncbi:MAG: RNA methyltransferase substrate-binding domain-containing protein, partial [Haemophilus parahaemolyticus]|nr:RNA methyltransferase substrate-binding domain-containing protein [Haemophilus parahaemolyticus]